MFRRNLNEYKLLIFCVSICIHQNVSLQRVILRKSRLQKWCPLAIMAFLLYLILTLILLVHHLLTLAIEGQRGRIHYCRLDPLQNGEVEYHISRDRDQMLNIFTLYIPLLFYSEPRSKQINVKLMQKLRKVHWTIEYEPFTIPPPFFIDDTDEKQFNTVEMNQEYLRPQNRTHLRGIVETVPNGIASYSVDCGWASQLNEFRQMVEWRSPQADVVVPLLVPDGYTFQHFIDGVLPKIIQAYDIIMLPGVKVAIDIPRDQIVYEMLAKLNITCDKIIFTTYIVSEVQINTCIAPPIHPGIWQDFRRKLGAKEHLHVRMRKAKVVLVTRAGSYNAGRNLLNFDEVVSYLHTRYGDTFHIFDGPYSLAKSIELFSNTRLIIGVHGGAFYNLNFAPMDTHIVEIMPVMEDGSPVPFIAHTIVWIMSQMLGQTFWRIHEPSLEGEWGDVVMQLPKLEKTLDKIDRIQNVQYTKQTIMQRMTRKFPQSEVD